MEDFNDLIKKALIIIVEKNFATKYLLKKNLKIDENTAEVVMSRLVSEGFVSPADSLGRRYRTCLQFFH